MTTHRVMTDGTLVSLSKKEKVSLVSFIYPPFRSYYKYIFCSVPQNALCKTNHLTFLLGMNARAF